MSSDSSVARRRSAWEGRPTNAPDLTVCIVLPVEIQGQAFLHVGDLGGRRLVVERAEWERCRPLRQWMEAFFWDRDGSLHLAPPLVPQKEDERKKG